MPGTLPSVLATGKKPLSEAASPAPGRTQKTEQRSRVARRRVLVGGCVALLAAGGLAFLLTRGGDIIPFGDENKHQIAALAFEARVVAVPTTDTLPTELKDVVAPAADGVVSTISALFHGAFIDPDVWDGDDYEDLFGAVMDEGTAAQALQDVDSLTLGTGAGDVYDFVDPEPNKLAIQVLTDRKDQPTQAIAKVTFRATAALDDGTFTAITVTGSFFLHEDGGTWRIFAYDVGMDEKARTAPVTATPTSSTEAS